MMYYIVFLPVLVIGWHNPKHLHALNPITLVQIFLILFLNIFADLTQKWCKFALGVLKLGLEASLGSGQHPVVQEQIVLKSFPTDI